MSMRKTDQSEKEIISNIMETADKVVDLQHAYTLHM
jgi:hypothetical protein